MDGVLWLLGPYFPFDFPFKENAFPVRSGGHVRPCHREVNRSRDMLGTDVCCIFACVRVLRTYLAMYILVESGRVQVLEFLAMGLVVPT